MPAFKLPSVLLKSGAFALGKHRERIELIKSIKLDQLISLLSTNEGRASLPFGKLSAFVYSRITRSDAERFQEVMLRDFSSSDIPQFIEAICRAEPKNGNTRDWSAGAQVNSELMALVLKHGTTPQVKKVLNGSFKFRHDVRTLCKSAFNDDLQPRKTFWLLVEHLKDDRRYLGALIAASERQPEVHEALLELTLSQLSDPEWVRRQGTGLISPYQWIFDQLAAYNSETSLKWLLARNPLQRESLERALRWCFLIGDEEARRSAIFNAHNIEAGTVIIDAWKVAVSKPDKGKAESLIEMAADGLLNSTWGKLAECDEGITELLAPLCSTKVLERVAARLEAEISMGGNLYGGHLEIIGDIARKRASGMTGTATLKIKTI